MINRKEEIKKKGFSIALASDTRATQSPFENVDFSKIKVGAKTLDDAIYTLGDLKKIDKTLADKIAENAESNSMLGVPTTSTTTTTTTKTSSSKNNTNNKGGSKSNIFTKVAGKVNAETLEGVLDAMAKKGLSETFTNARKVGDQVGVDFIKRQFLSALDEKLV